MRGRERGGREGEREGRSEEGGRERGGEKGGREEERVNKSALSVCSSTFGPGRWWFSGASCNCLSYRR